MLLELHIIQNFAPSNLNRDDTGSPKSCEFGGYRRARISSQSIKRAIRTEFKARRDAGLFPSEAIADRTKRLVSEVMAPRLQERLSLDYEAAQQLARAGLAAVGGFTDKEPDPELAHRDNLTQYLLFIAPNEATDLVDFCVAQKDALQKAFPDIYGADGKTRITSADAKKKAYQRLRSAVGKEAFETLQKRLNGGRAADLALFGRMLADLPERNIDAASQVAHAISTHHVNADFDYYTALDDLKPDDTPGADMIGTVEFNSACYYRYANVDLGQLKKNLDGDVALAEATVRAFLLASRDAIPTGKQNSFAARNAPSFVMPVVRKSGAWSLANAFVQPVRAYGETSLVHASIQALDTYWGELTAMYDLPPGATVAVCALGKVSLPNLGDFRVPTFSELVERTLAAARPALGG